MTTYNPYLNPTQANYVQSRLDLLNRQKSEIDNQINALNSQMTPPPIHQTFINGNPQPEQNFDFRGKWVSNKQEAEQIANNNTPVILLDNNESKFYMRDPNGKLRTYKFEEVIEKDPVETQNAEISALKEQLANQEKALSQIVQFISQNQSQAQPEEDTEKKSKRKAVEQNG